MDTFYGLKLAYIAGRRGGSLPTVFNAANELAVQQFLKKRDQISGDYGDHRGLHPGA